MRKIICLGDFHEDPANLRVLKAAVPQLKQRNFTLLLEVMSSTKNLKNVLTTLDRFLTVITHFPTLKVPATPTPSQNQVIKRLQSCGVTDIQKHFDEEPYKMYLSRKEWLTAFKALLEEIEKEKAKYIFYDLYTEGSKDEKTLNNIHDNRNAHMLKIIRETKGDLIVFSGLFHFINTWDKGVYRFGLLHYLLENNKEDELQMYMFKSENQLSQEAESQLAFNNDKIISSVQKILVRDTDESLHAVVKLLFESKKQVEIESVAQSKSVYKIYAHSDDIPFAENIKAYINDLGGNIKDEEFLNGKKFWITEFNPTVLKAARREVLGLDRKSIPELSEEGRQFLQKEFIGMTIEPDLQKPGRWWLTFASDFLAKDHIQIIDEAIKTYEYKNEVEVSSSSKSLRNIIAVADFHKDPIGLRALKAALPQLKQQGYTFLMEIMAEDQDLDFILSRFIQILDVVTNFPDLKIPLSVTFEQNRVLQNFRNGGMSDTDIQRDFDSGSYQRYFERKEWLKAYIEFLNAIKIYKVEFVFFDLFIEGRLDIDKLESIHNARNEHMMKIFKKTQGNVVVISGFAHFFNIWNNGKYYIGLIQQILEHNKNCAPDKNRFLTYIFKSEKKTWETLEVHIGVNSDEIIGNIITYVIHDNNDNFLDAVKLLCEPPYKLKDPVREKNIPRIKSEYRIHAQDKEHSDNLKAYIKDLGGNIRTEEIYHGLKFWIVEFDPAILTAPRREIFKLDRKSIPELSDEGKEFLRKELTGITIEPDLQKSGRWWLTFMGKLYPNYAKVINSAVKAYEKGNEVEKESSIEFHKK